MTMRFTMLSEVVSFVLTEKGDAPQYSEQLEAYAQLAEELTDRSMTVDDFDELFVDEARIAATALNLPFPPLVQDDMGAQVTSW